MIKKSIVYITFIVLFVSFAHNYLSFKLWDYDFWWHISTGKYISEKGLPDNDPFNFTTALEENKTSFSEKRTRFLLKQYWLSQLLMYKIYDAFKEKGIIILRSFILLFCLFLILWWFKKRDVDFYISFPSIFLVYTATMSFLGERPVLFTLLLSIITFMIVENFRENRDSSIYLLSPVMLLWANLHGGYILGIAIISAYLIDDIIEFIRNRKDKKNILLKGIMGYLIAVLASFINPNRWDVFPLLLAREGRFFTENVQEYYSPFFLYKMNLRSVDWGYLVLIGLTFLIMLLRFKKMAISRYILLLGLLLESILSLRFLIYYVTIGTMIIGEELSFLLKERVERLKALQFVILILAFVSSVLFGLGFIDPSKISFQKATTFSVPEGAAKFISLNNIEGNIFNDMGSGGYLIWELYPKNKVFIDTRSLNGNALLEHGWILAGIETLNPEGLKKGKKPLWKRLLDHYNVNIIVLNTMDAFGNVPPLIFLLLDSEEWKPVYASIAHVVFLRNTEKNKGLIERYRINKDVILDVMISRFSSTAIANKKNPNFMISLGDIFFYMKRYDDALKAYQYAEKRRPRAEDIIFKIERTKKEIIKDKEVKT